jgi:hypothetical protein
VLELVIEFSLPVHKGDAGLRTTLNVEVVIGLGNPFQRSLPGMAAQVA